MRTEPGKVDGNSLSKVFPDVVEWLILKPLAPPAREGITKRKEKDHVTLPRTDRGSASRSADHEEDIGLVATYSPPAVKYL